MISRRTLKIILGVVVGLLILSFILPYDPTTYGINSDPVLKSDITFAGTHAQSHGQNESRDKEEKKSRVEENKPRDEKPLSRDEKKLFVILVTGFRTGSTFLGELFNQNPDVLYLFEPFHQNHIRSLASRSMIKGVTSESTLLEQRTAYLEQIISECRIEQGFFGDMTKNMKCGTEAENLRHFGSITCDTSPGKWNRMCERKNTVALKLIRLQRIQHLELVPGIKEANIKVIHLIRDPRGTMNSRLGFSTFGYWDDSEKIKINPLTPENMKIAAANLCDREWENLKFSADPPEWLKGRYFRITHDEMSLDPIESAKRVYKFVGLSIPPDMNQFLIDHTTHQEKGVLNTRKDSAAVLRKWREKLKPEIIDAIEEKCKNVMDFMHYQSYNYKDMLPDNEPHL